MTCALATRIWRRRAAAFPPDHSVADPSPSHAVEIANAEDVQVISQIIDSVVKTYLSVGCRRRFTLSLKRDRV